jgi:hypothetical protein
MIRIDISKESIENVHAMQDQLIHEMSNQGRINVQSLKPFVSYLEF